MNVGDKVIADGKETEIIATAFDDVGTKVYMVKGSMKDYYEEELELVQEEEDIKILNNYLDRNDRKFVSLKRFKFLQAIENLINKYKEQEKIIDLMAKAIHNYEDWTDTVCNIVDCRSTPHCNAETEEQEIKCIIEYYEKKAKEME